MWCVWLCTVSWTRRFWDVDLDSEEEACFRVSKNLIVQRMESRKVLDSFYDTRGKPQYQESYSIHPKELL